MYKYLLWDIDGTVLNFHASEAYAIRKLFMEYNLCACTDEMLRKYSKINEKYWKMVERNELSKSEILVGRFREFFAGIGVDESIAKEFNEKYQVVLGDYVEFVDKAEEILFYQKGRYILAAVTNGTRVAQERRLRLSGLDKVFDAIFISEVVGFEKPSKAYFDYVFENLGITNKKEVLIIGDSLTSDMMGGSLAEIDTCWFNPEHRSNSLDISVTYEIDNLAKLNDILSV